MSAECERAARVRTLPIRKGGTPLLVRTEFITRTTARSLGVARTPLGVERFRVRDGTGTGPSAHGERETEREHHDAEKTGVPRHQEVGAGS